jgi:hypothetical protein
VRFHVYVAESVNAYSFDDFSVTALTAGVRGGSSRGQALQVRLGRDNFVLTLDGGISGNLKAELLDLRGMSLATATGRADGSLVLAHPRESGAYLIRASTTTRSWVRKVSIR